MVVGVDTGIGTIGPSGQDFGLGFEDIDNTSPRCVFHFKIILTMQAGQASLPQTTLISFQNSAELSNNAGNLRELQAASFRDGLVNHLPASYQVAWGYWQKDDLMVGVLDCLLLKSSAEPVFQRGEFKIAAPSDLLVALNWRSEKINAEDLLNIFVEADACYDASAGGTTSQVRYGWAHPDGGKASYTEIQIALNASGLNEITLENKTESNPEIWLFEKRKGKWYLSGIMKDDFMKTLASGLGASAPRRRLSRKRKKTSIVPVGRDDKGKFPIHTASELGKVKQLEKILQEGADPNERDFSFNSPLHLASAANQAECVKVLIKYGAEWQALNNKGKSSLHEAAANGSMVAAKVLIESGADANSLMDRKITPLHAASWNGHLDMVAYLVSVGADINAINEDGNTCLHFAAGNGQIKIVKTLIQHGANPDLLNHRQLDYLSVINEGYSGPPIPVM